MATFRKIKSRFQKLSDSEKNSLLKKVWNYSPDMKMFLSGHLLDNINEQLFINKMKKETTGKIKRKGTPGMLNGRIINSIITKAKKSNVSSQTLIELEKLAYRGFIDFLNEFGGGPDNYEDMAGRHLENYLKFVKECICDKLEQEEIFEETKRYLLKKDNMITDYMDDIFETVSGVSISRY